MHKLVWIEVRASGLEGFFTSRIAVADGVEVNAMLSRCQPVHQNRSGYGRSIASKGYEPDFVSFRIQDWRDCHALDTGANRDGGVLRTQSHSASECGGNREQTDEESINFQSFSLSFEFSTTIIERNFVMS
jgi:hypothetical protein